MTCIESTVLLLLLLAVLAVVPLHAERLLSLPASAMASDPQLFALGDTLALLYTTAVDAAPYVVLLDRDVAKPRAVRLA